MATNSYFPYAATLELAGVDPTDALIKNVECPVCHKLSLVVSADPRGGFVYRCYHCDILCGSLQLLATAKSTSLTEAARLLELKVRNIPYVKLDIDKYAKQTEGQLNNILARLAQDRKDFVDGTNPTFFKLAEQYGLWFSRDDELLSRTFGKYLGGSILDHWYPFTYDLPDIMKTFYEKRLRAILTLPYCDVFHRPASLLLFSSTSVSFMPTNIQPITGEGGLCFLDDVPRGTAHVYGIGGYAEAAQLKFMQILQNINTLHIVGWLKRTKTTWQYMDAGCVTLWEPRPSVNIFKQAMEIGNARVALHPVTAKNELIDIGLFAWKRQVDAAAKPWRVALGDWLLSLSSSDAMDAVKELMLPPSSIRTVVEAYPESMRQRLANLFGLSGLTKKAQLKNISVEQCGDKWYFETQQGAEKAILLDSVISLEAATRKADGTVLFSGSVLHDGDTIPFVVNSATVQGSGGKIWLRKFMTERGYPVPIVAGGSKITDDLFTIAQLFYNPKVIAADVSCVGWRADGSFVFPNFVIKNGETLEQTSILVPGKKLPVPFSSLALTPPIGQLTTALQSMSGFMITGWAFTLSLLMNLLAPLKKKESRNVAYLVNDEDDFNSLKAYAEAFSLPIVPLDAASKSDALEEGALAIFDARAADIPTLWEYISVPDTTPSILVVSDLKAWDFYSLLGWVVIDGRQANGSRTSANMLPRLLISFLAKLQIAAYDEKVVADLETLVSKASKYYEAYSAGMANAIQGRLKGECTYTSTKADRALSFLASISKEAFRNRKSAVIKSEEDGSLIMPIDLTKRALSKLGVPVGPINKLVTDAAGAGVSLIDHTKLSISHEAIQRVRYLKRDYSASRL